MQDATEAAGRAARESFGRLLSWLAWQWRDIAAAEDALSDALLKALEVWPRDGIPQSPEAWLLAVAKRQLLQVARHDRMRQDPALTVLLAQDELAGPEPAIPDARLKLMFVCAHPAIDEKVRTALMLQTVLGLQVADIAPAMLMSPAALAQRLVRAKQKIRDTGLRFEEPEPRDLPQRLHHVLESIYGAFGLGADAVDGAEDRIADLQHEALFLCDLLCALMPDAAEARGLLALMLFSRSRAAAQWADDGRFVPLRLQDAHKWDREAIIRADQVLLSAARMKQPGPFQLEAAIHSAHCHRLFTGSTPWGGIAALYAQINQHFPTSGSRVAGAVATAEAGDVAAGLSMLDAMDPARMRAFQPWWVARGYLLGLDGRPAQAEAALATAVGLSTHPRIKDYLLEQRRSYARAVAGGTLS